MQRPKFIYFDLGNVLLNFTVERMCRQVAAASGLTPQRAHELLFGGRLQEQCELGCLAPEEFHAAFCRASGTAPSAEAFTEAASDIFDPNEPVVPLVRELGRAGFPLGVLSNTSAGHWEWCLRRFGLLREVFGVYVLSFEVGAMKPAEAIFHEAVRRAGVAPDEIFYTDDIAGHVAGARAAGLDAVQYLTAEQLREELHQRGALG